MDKKKGKEESLKHKTRELGAYSRKLICDGLEEVIEKYFIEQCGAYEEYLKADIFRQAEQDIVRNCNVLENAKRKQEFAEAHKLETKKRAWKKRPLQTR